MIEVIVNNPLDEPKLHLRVDGRTHEECNVDDMGSDTTSGGSGGVQVYDLGDFFEFLKEQGTDLEYTLCARCFP